MTDAGLSWRTILRMVLCAVCVVMLCDDVSAAPPDPLLSTVFPAGCQAGTSVELALAGSALEGLRTVQCNAAGVVVEVLEANRVRMTVPADTTPGFYDLWAITGHGISSPRTFVISNRSELSETEPNQEVTEAQLVSPNTVVNGRIEKGGDVDCFRFAAAAGQRIIFDCAAERIDSRLRPVLQILNDQGRQLAVSRGYFGIDPLIDFLVPADGYYFVQIQDLTSTGGAEHLYRLDIDSEPRVLFARPDVIQYGQSATVELFGWNLNQNAPGNNAPPGTVERMTVEIQAPAMPSATEAAAVSANTATSSSPTMAQRRPAQATGAEFSWYLPGSQAAMTFALTDIPVSFAVDNHSQKTAQILHPPSVVSGQLASLHQQDWFAIEARRGEVFHVEVFADRLRSPLDPEISIYDDTGERELANFSDEARSIGGKMCPTSHLDPAGRWVAPADGTVLINVRNIGGGASEDARRIYRLSVRREEPGVELFVIPRRDGAGRLNLSRGGREILDIVAVRQRGFSGPIRISAHDLPSGVECPDIWLGPGVNRGVIVVSADHGANEGIGSLRLIGTASGIAPVSVRSATVVRTGIPNGWSRLTSQLPLAVAGEAPVRISANAQETLEHHIYGALQVQHSPGGILDVAVQIDRRDEAHQAPVRLWGVGLPRMVRNETSEIPAGQTQGSVSFCLPPSLPPGQYSLAIQAETTVPASDQKSEAIVLFSNSVAFDVKPGAFIVEADPFAQRIVRRGETFHVKYASHRQNGFIGKMHTELAVPGIITNVPGLRGRGETFTGQTETGSLQIEVNNDAPLGHQKFLRLFTVGVVEDDPVFFGSCFLPLEVVE